MHTNPRHGKQAVGTLILFFIFLSSVSADGTGIAPHPKVALVLSGGGALGFAHIGVLKVVEELGIPTDCVVGTSMGSLVGGLYAIGYDAAALEKIALESDWQSLFIDAVPRSSSSYMEKKLSRPYPASFGFDAKGLAVSSGLSAGQRARDYLAFLTLAYAENTDFSSLPREYRAVATDVSTGAEVVLSKGFLADAMRASMSVPGVFTPHEIDGRFLMDGMLVKNLPVSVAKDLGADLVIAVDIGKMDVAPEEVDNPGASLDRMLSIFINQNRAPERRLADVLIEPDTEGFSSGSFGSAKELIARGEAAARAAMPALRALAERIKKDRPEARARVIGKSPEPVKIGRIEVRGVAGEEAAKLKAAFDPYLGRLTQPEELQAATVRIFSSGDWEFLRFGFRRETDGTVTLVLTAKTKRKPTVLLRIGLGFDGHLGLGADASWSDLEADERSLNFNITTRDVFRPGSFWSTDFTLAEPGGVASEYILPLGGPFFAAQGLAGSSEKIPIYTDQKLADEFRVRKASAHFRIGTFLGNWGEFSAGYAIKHIESSPRFYGQSAAAPDFRGFLGIAFLSFDADTLSSMPFPETGILVSASYSRAEDWLGSSRYINKFEADTRSYVSPADRHTIGFHAAGGTAFDGNLDFWNRFFVGGRSSLIGYYENSLSGDHYCLLDLEYRYRLPGLGLPFKDAVYFRLRGAAGNTWQGEFPEGTALTTGWRYGAGLGVGVNTFLGAFNADCAVSDQGAVIFYISLGMKL